MEIKAYMGLRIRLMLLKVYVKFKYAEHSYHFILWDDIARGSYQFLYYSQFLSVFQYILFGCCHQFSFNEDRDMFLNQSLFSMFHRKDTGLVETSKTILPEVTTT